LKGTAKYTRRGSGWLSIAVGLFEAGVTGIDGGHDPIAEIRPELESKIVMPELNLETPG
jgi:hypothetical protein